MDKLHEQCFNENKKKIKSLNAKSKHAKFALGQYAHLCSSQRQNCKRSSQKMKLHKIKKGMNYGNGFKVEWFDPKMHSFARKKLTLSGQVAMSSIVPNEFDWTNFFSPPIKVTI